MAVVGAGVPACEAAEFGVEGVDEWRIGGGGPPRGGRRGVRHADHLPGRAGDWGPPPIVLGDYLSLRGRRQGESLRWRGRRCVLGFRPAALAGGARRIDRTRAMRRATLDSAGKRPAWNDRPDPVRIRPGGPAAPRGAGAESKERSACRRVGELAAVLGSPGVLPQRRSVRSAVSGARFIRASLNFW